MSYRRYMEEDKVDVVLMKVGLNVKNWDLLSDEEKREVLIREGNLCGEPLLEEDILTIIDNDN